MISHVKKRKCRHHASVAFAQLSSTPDQNEHSNDQDYYLVNSIVSFQSTLSPNPSRRSRGRRWGDLISVLCSNEPVNNGVSAASARTWGTSPSIRTCVLTATCCRSNLPQF